jgi:hypothetical protein
MEDKIIPGTSSDNEESLPGYVGKAVPEPDASRESDSSALPRHMQSLLDARGIGAELANEEDPDDYIRRLRKGWD